MNLIKPAWLMEYFKNCTNFYYNTIHKHLISVTQHCTQIIYTSRVIYLNNTTFCIHAVSKFDGFQCPVCSMASSIVSVRWLPVSCLFDGFQCPVCSMASSVLSVRVIPVSCQSDSSVLSVRVIPVSCRLRLEFVMLSTLLHVKIIWRCRFSYVTPDYYQCYLWLKWIDVDS